jgi:UDPglucose 6-dehydrogenase
MGAITIGFAGLTHLGLNSALAAADKGFSVIGWDQSDELVKQLGRAEIPINEPGFESLFSECRDRLSFTSKINDLRHCDIIYLATDVPTDDSAKSDLSPIEALLEQLSSHVEGETVVVILSQVPPGFTDTMSDRFSSLFYQVETLIFGRAVERATTPDRLIVGTRDPALALPTAYQLFLKSFGCPIMPMHYESAELCKIAINCFLVASVSTTNALSNICEKIGADWNEITPALRLDPRIGQHAYLLPGLGISGGNLERDLRNVVEIAAANNVDAGPIQEYRRFSETSKDWALRALMTALDGSLEGRTIGVLGLAYKDNTHSTKNSPALRLIGNLEGCTIRVYDPVVPATAAPSAVGAQSPADCLDGCDAICIMTPWDEFREIDATELHQRMSGAQVIDPYGLLDSKALAKAGLTHFVRGRPTA